MRHRCSATVAFQRIGSVWFGDELGAGDLLVFELFPWHSTAVTGAMRPSPTIISELVWSPIGELDAKWVFAFGKEWRVVAAGLNLPPVAALGKGR